MEVYRKIAVARNEDDVRQIKDELADVYGPIPQEAEMVLNLAELRIKAGRLDIKNISVSGQDLVFSFAEKRSVQKLERLFAKTAGKVIILDPQTVHLRLNKNYFEPQTLIRFLRRILDGERR
jgi:transcription-repair coupling factor (superfamily II helicase)